MTVLFARRCCRRRRRLRRRRRAVPSSLNHVGRQRIREAGTLHACLVRPPLYLLACIRISMPASHDSSTREGCAAAAAAVAVVTATAVARREEEEANGSAH